MFLHQVRQIVRRLRASPSFTFLSLLILAGGIAANVAIFSVVNAILLRPLPYPDSQALVLLWNTAPAIDLPMLGQAEATYFHVVDKTRTLESMAMMEDEQMTLGGDGRPERVQAARATASLFEVLQVRPALGREFLESEERPGGEAVVVLSDRLWQRRFAGDESVLGKRVEIDGVLTEIVGVLPRGFEFPDPETELWVPMVMDPALAQLDGFGLIGLGRLVEGASAADVEAEFNGLFSGLAEAFPDDDAAPMLLEAGFSAMIRPAHEFLVGDLRPALWIVLGAVAFLLLIACANVANLFLARSEGRQRELAIRFALGESRARISTTTLFESTTLGALGGLIGIPLGVAAMRLLVSYGPQEVPRLQETTVDLTVVGFGVAVSLVSGVLFGVIPALRTAVGGRSLNLSEGGRGASAGRGRHRTRSILVCAQIALALVLLVGSGLAARSFQALANVDPGFDPRDVFSFSLFLPESDYAETSSLMAFYDDLKRELEGLPGVSSAAGVSYLPMSGSMSGTGFSFEGRPPLADNVLPPILFTKQVTADYLQTMRIAVLEGRSLERQDGEHSTVNVVVNETLARRQWPNESALGKGLFPGARPEEGEPWFRVVGVVADVRDRGLQEEGPELVYFPLQEESSDGHERPVPRTLSFVVRAAPGSELAGPIRDRVTALDPAVPVADFQLLRAKVAESMQGRAFTLSLLLVAAGFALLLGGIGLYGVISYLVAQRRREIAIRMAVGARDGDIRSMVLREALTLGGVGIGVGLLVAAGVTRLLSSLLYEVKAWDPITFISVPIVLLLVSLAASYLPARRAARMDPVVSLYHE